MYLKSKSTLFFSIILLVITLTSCGGGGGGGSNTAGEENSNTDEETANDDSDAATDQDTIYRITQIRYDLDNDGTFEGTRDFQYDENGKILEHRYTYVSDGLANTQLFQYAISSNYTGLDDIDEVTNFTYDASGRLEALDTGIDTARIRYNYTYSGNTQLISQVRFTQFDANGGVSLTFFDDLSYDVGLLREHTSYNDGIPDPVQTWTISYNENSQVETNTHIVHGTDYHSEITLTYLEDGRINNVTTTSSENNPPLVKRFTYEYNERDLLYKITMTHPDSAESFSVEKNFNSLSNTDAQYATLLEIDKGLNGSIDAVIEVEWETEQCEPVMGWLHQGYTVANIGLDAPYLMGTGYFLNDFCTDYY